MTGLMRLATGRRLCLSEISDCLFNERMKGDWFDETGNWS